MVILQTAQGREEAVNAFYIKRLPQQTI